MFLTKYYLSILMPLMMIGGMAHANDTPSVDNALVQVENVPGPQDDWNDPEHVSDIDVFLRHGYKMPDWISNEALMIKVYNELVVPDWERRNGGKKNTIGGSIDLAQAYITKRGFNDIVIVSRLPGDCSELGCLHQIYSLIGQQWHKQLEFTAYNFAFKDGKVDGQSLVVAVGDDEHPSTLHYWDGEKFTN